MTLERLPDEEVRRSSATAASPAASDAGGDPWVPTGSPWLRWLRPRGSARRSSGGSSSRGSCGLPLRDSQQAGAGEAQLVPADENVNRQQFDALEDRLLRLVAGMHQQLNQQVAADREESDRLAERTASRFEVQINMAEQHRQRAERRMTELTCFLQNLEEEQQAQGRRMGLLGDLMHSTQASRSQDQMDMQHRLADIEEDQRALAAQSMVFAAQDEEAQRHYSQRIRPIEDRLSALENERRRSEASAGLDSQQSLPDAAPMEIGDGPACSTSHPSSQRYAAGGALVAVQELEATLLQETRTVHDRCNHMQDVVDNHVIHPLQQLERRVEALAGGEREHISKLQAQERRLGLQASKLEEQEGQLAHVKEWLERMSTRLSNSIKCDKLCDPWAHNVGGGSSNRVLACHQFLDNDVAKGALELPRATGCATELELRIDACEHASRQLREQFAERSAELARCVQAGFTEARSHLEAVSEKLAQLHERVRRTEEMRGSVKDSPGENASTVQDLSGVSLDRIEQLEQCVRENAAATGAMREHVHLIQGRLCDIKDSINLAICEQRSRSETSHCEGRSLDVIPMSAETSEVFQESPVRIEAAATEAQTADTTLEIAVPDCAAAVATASDTAREAELVLEVMRDCNNGSEAPTAVKELEEQLARLSESLCLQENIVAALQGQLRDTAARSLEFEGQLVRLSEAQTAQQSSITGVQGQVKDLPQQLEILAARIGGLEARAHDDLGAGMAAEKLQLKVDSLEARLASRHDTNSVDARAMAERLEQAELMVTEIRGQVSDLGRQVEESSPHRMSLELGTDPVSCGVSEPFTLAALPTSAARESPMARADAFLDAVEQIIAKQQIELSRLLAELNMQFREVAAREISDEEEASVAARAPIQDVVEADAGASAGCPATAGAAVSPSGTEDCTELEALHMSEVAEALTSWVEDAREAAPQAASGSVDSPRAVRQVQSATACDTDGIATAEDLESYGEGNIDRLPTRGLGLRPWSALAHLSAALTGFEAALSGAEEAAAGANESS